MQLVVTQNTERQQLSEQAIRSRVVKHFSEREGLEAQYNEKRISILDIINSVMTQRSIRVSDYCIAQFTAIARGDTV